MINIFRKMIGEKKEWKQMKRRAKALSLIHIYLWHGCSERNVTHECKNHP